MKSASEAAAMTRKKKAAVSAHNSMMVMPAPGETSEEAIARGAVQPTVTAATIAKAFSSRMFGDMDVTATHKAIHAETDRVNRNDMRGVESTLVAQAVALNSIFTDLAHRAALNAGEYMAATETYLKLALRAQNQCRMTLETLATIKNPPVVFARQANIANNQQVNNGAVVPVTHAGETELPQTEQSRITYDERQSLDTGALRAAAASDSAMETVDAINRPAHGRGQGKIEP